MDKFVLIIAMVNTGFTELVMDAARSEGAYGGTVVHARGTGNKEMEKRFGIIITPDKEMVLIVVNDKISDKVLKAIYEKAGLQTKGQGIAFSLPVEDVVGLKFEHYVVDEDKKKKKEAESKEEKASKETK
ncbi:MAG: P-II family nitrogen regulator [Bacilli bacterium]|nr:P-II family nitrogen regulator [Bacilli bacterium]